MRQHCPRSALLDQANNICTVLYALSTCRRLAHCVSALPSDPECLNRVWSYLRGRGVLANRRLQYGVHNISWHIVNAGCGLTEMTSGHSCEPPRIVHFSAGYLASGRFLRASLRRWLHPLRTYDGSADATVFFSMRRMVIKCSHSAIFHHSYVQDAAFPRPGSLSALRPLSRLGSRPGTRSCSRGDYMRPGRCSPGSGLPSRASWGSRTSL